MRFSLWSLRGRNVIVTFNCPLTWACLAKFNTAFVGQCRSRGTHRAILVVSVCPASNCGPTVFHVQKCLARLRHSLRFIKAKVSHTMIVAELSKNSCGPCPWLSVSSSAPKSLNSSWFEEQGSQAHHTYLTQRSNGMAEEAQSDQLCVPALRNNLDFLFLFRVDKLLVPPMYGVQNSCLAHTVPHIPI